MANPQLPFSEYSKGSQTTAPEGGEGQGVPTSADVTTTPLAGSLTVSGEVPASAGVTVATPQTVATVYGSGKPRRIIIRGKIAHEQDQG